MEESIPEGTTAKSYVTNSARNGWKAWRKLTDRYDAKNSADKETAYSKLFEPGKNVGQPKSAEAALDALTRSFAVEFAEHNILVNSIAPGYIETDMMKQYNSEKELDIIKNSIPMKRFGKKTEISELVKFLCSEKNSYITGQILTIDGGFACK